MPKLRYLVPAILLLAGGGAAAWFLLAAVIDVDELGTRAAAVVADGSKSVSGHFIADHPFLYLIRDTKRGTILFLGRFATP